MLILEWTIALLAAAVALSALARRWRLPYPALLAAMGAALAFAPGAPRFVLDPQLALALFVAPVLLDTAYDTSPRDLRNNWRSITNLVLVAVGVTTIAVAWTAKLLVPDLPWAAAIALGAIVAPPDAAAATAVLRETRPPHRILQILEGESLLNDASALLVYRFAVGAAMGESLSTVTAVPVLLGTLVGSIALGLAFAWVAPKLLNRIDDVAMSTVLQFVTMWGVWISAEALELSGILAMVAFAIAIARSTLGVLPARIRVPSLAMWSTVVFVLNVLAFVLIGLQIGPILDRLDVTERIEYAKVAATVLAVVIVVRIAWVMVYYAFRRWSIRRRSERSRKPSMAAPSVKAGLLIGWCGMRGIVTLAAALALPESFPGRRLILVVAFTVVLGTLLIQGLTLRPLLLAFDFHDEDPVERETKLARQRVMSAALASLDDDTSKAAKVLRFELREWWPEVTKGESVPAGLPQLRHHALRAARRELSSLLHDDTIGDDAYRRIEGDLDRAELYAEVGSEPVPLQNA